MTHFRTISIGEYDEEELCNKYSEFTEVPEYEEIVCTGDKKWFLKSMFDMSDFTNADVDKLFKDRYLGKVSELYNSNRFYENKNGEFVYKTTYNKNSRFDYFVEEDMISLGEIKEDVNGFLSNCCAIIKDNIWYDFCAVGWYGTTWDHKNDEEKKELIETLLKGTDENTPIYILDCHI